MNISQKKCNIQDCISDVLNLESGIWIFEFGIRIYYLVSKRLRVCRVAPSRRPSAGGLIPYRLSLAVAFNHYLMTELFDIPALIEPKGILELKPASKVNTRRIG